VGEYIGLVHVVINNPENCKGYIPIVRKFNMDSLNVIKSNAESGSYVMSFDWDREKAASKIEFTNTIKNLIGIGAELSLYKDFFNEKMNGKDTKEIHLKSILAHNDTVDVSKHLRIPIKLKQLVMFNTDELDEYAIYTESNRDNIDADTVFYIDETVEVDENDTEIYPTFVQENKLEIYFLGFQVADIIDNTRYQLSHKKPSVSDYIKNFNNYSKHDCYFDFG